MSNEYIKLLFEEFHMNFMIIRSMCKCVCIYMHIAIVLIMSWLRKKWSVKYANTRNI